MDYSSLELADAYFVYGLANGNSSAAQSLYHARFPNRTLEAIYRCLKEHKTFKSITGGSAYGRRELPNFSTQQVATTYNVDQMGCGECCMKVLCIRAIYSMFRP
ncbi:hypothetical protein PR048_021688 [Dryococelus australis]|uniref:DUF4817 domain-containing protein n=1 Tax=Dryococelus australis TaxID=614101 RepID=A0ABQ9GYW2_9NEOP|nr:hypothetical protein PR048_021688 [Dryococelus australis]